MLSLVWQHEGMVTSELAYAITFPGRTTAAELVSVGSNALELGMREILTGVKFYLTGGPEDVRQIQTVWPYLGGLSDESSPGAMDAVHLRPEMDGGVEISFDRGRNWIRLQYIAGNLDGGNAGDPTTGIALPGTAVGLQGINATLAPLDRGYFLLRVIVPPAADTYRRYDVRLGVDFDIV